MSQPSQPSKQPNKEPELMEKIASLCKRRGFIFQSSEIYGGINGFWDYGPLGAELKRNVKELWWRSMTRLRDDIVGLDASIIMHPAVWKASGHVDTFSDPLAECPITNKRYRTDQIEPQSGTVYHFEGALDISDFNKFVEAYPEDVRPEVSEELKHFWSDPLIDVEPGFDRIIQKYPHPTLSTLAVVNLFQNSSVGTTNDPFSVLLPLGKPAESARKVAVEFYQRRGIANPELKGERTEKVENTTRFNPENGALLTEPRPFNLMLKTHTGPVESEENAAYLRPETAQAIFAQFKNVLETSRQKVPFGIAQIGKAFRNEINPRNYTFRSREFEQMELEFFIRPDEAVEAIHGAVATVANREAFVEADSQVANRDLNVVGESPTTARESRTLPGNLANSESVANDEAGENSANRHLGEPQPNWGWELWHAYWVEERIRFYESIGLSRDTLVEYWQEADELAHYSKACVDILYKFPFSKRDGNGELAGEELEGIAARGDFDLSQHKRHSGKPMHVFDEELKAAWTKLDDANREKISASYYDSRFRYLTKSGVSEEEAAPLAREDAAQLARGNYIPHVIEPSAGVDRLLLALICNAYHEEITVSEKGKEEKRTVMRFHPRIAPIKVGVFPLLKNKPELVAKAREVLELLRPHMNVFYDETGSIGRRYARQDEAGTPFGVTIDFDTLGEENPETKDTVTLRHRDSQKQERIAISELLGILLPQVQ